MLRVRLVCFCLFFLLELFILFILHLVWFGVLLWFGFVFCLTFVLTAYVFACFCGCYWFALLLFGICGFCALVV